MADARHPPRTGVLTIFHYLGYLFPFMLMLGGYMVPAMRYPVFGGMPDTLAFQWMTTLFITAMFGTVWIVMDFFTISNHNTPVSRLKENVHFSLAATLLLVGASTALYASGNLPWWFVLPTIATIVDVFITCDRAVENAVQKPIIQQERVHH